MKLKKVISLCLGKGRMELYDKEDSTGEVTQWLGDGCACYRLGGMPYLREDTAFNVFDVPEKKREKIIFTAKPLPERLEVGDMDPTADRRMDEVGLYMELGQERLLPMAAGDGVLLVQSKYIEPLWDVMDRTEFVERTTEDGQRYIVAMVGLLAEAVIMPYDASKSALPQVLGALVDRLRWEERHRINEE